jgi:hypothetical protein
MVRRFLRAIPWPRGKVLHFAAIAVLPLAALACLLAWRHQNSAPAAGERSARPESTQDRRGADEDTDAIPTAKGSHKDPPHLSQDALFAVALARLHSDATRRFVAAPGNGVGRFGQIPQTGQFNQIGQSVLGGQVPLVGRLGTLQQQLPQFPQLVERDWTVPSWSPGELSDDQRVEGVEDLETIHRVSVADFSPSSGVSSVRAAQPAHRTARLWEVKSIDLVGLLMHDEPVVYVSHKLEMAKLDRVPTRDLDFFESAGLAQLQKGKEIFARGQKETIRFLGAVRAQKQCLSCHDVSEGTLLGAFSYTLRPALYQFGRVPADQSKTVPERKPTP